MFYPETGRYVWDQNIDYQGVPHNEVLTLAYLSTQRNKVARFHKMLLCAADGAPRSGKTTWEVFKAHAFDPTFMPNFNKRMVQNEDAFMDAIDWIAAHKIDGAWVHIDEAGITANASRWYDKWNTTLSETMQMVGYLHPIISMSTPVQDFIDSRLRKLFSTYDYVRRYSNETSIISPYEINYSSTRKKHFFKSPRIRLAGTSIRLAKIFFHKPPDSFMDMVDKYDLSVKEPLRLRIKGRLIQSSIKKIREEIDMNKVITDVISNYNIFKADRSTPAEPKLDPLRIEFGTKATTKQAKYIKGEGERRMREAIKEKIDAEKATKQAEDAANEKKEEAKEADEVREDA